MINSPWDIPGKWEWTEIKSIGDVVSGGTPSTKIESYWGNEINWISPSDLTGYTNISISKGAKSITEEGLKNSSAKLMPAGSVHFSSRAPIGYVAVSSQPICTNQGFKSIVPANGMFNEYIYYYLKAVKQIAEERATGTTFKEISGTAFGKLPIPITTTNEQHRIVAKLEELFSELDKGIESLKRAREQLKVYRQALLKHAFEGKLTEQWRKDNAGKLETADQLLERIKKEREARHQKQLEEWQAAVKQWEASEKSRRKPSKPKKLIEINSSHIHTSEAPQGWAFVQAVYVSDFITKGTTPKKDDLYSGSGEIPFIKVYNLTKNGRLDFSIDPTYVLSKTHNDDLHRSRCIPGDVLMNIVGPPLGKVSIVPNTHQEWNINQAIARYRTRILDSEFLSNYLLSEAVVRSMMRKSKATAGQFNLTLEICRDTLLPVCSRYEQMEMIRILDERLSVIDSLDDDIERNLLLSEALRQSILKRAFSGQLVPQDPNDEPASVLLERIAAEKAELATLAKGTKAAAKKAKSRQKSKQADANA